MADDDEPIDLRILVQETARTLFWTVFFVAVTPIVVATLTDPFTGEDGDTLVRWPLSRTVWVDGAIRLPFVLALVAIPWAAFKAVECSWVWLICAWPIVAPVWFARWLFVNWWRAILKVAVVAPVVPLVAAWAEKIAWHLGNVWANGRIDTEHVFMSVYTDSFLAGAERIGASRYLVESYAFRSTGMAPDWNHWLMGVSAVLGWSAQCVAVACILAPFYFGGMYIIKRTRNRQRVKRE